MIALRVVYLEDREGEFHRWKSVIERCIVAGDVPAEVQWAPDEAGFTDALLTHPHIAICDLDLRNGTHAGAQIIDRVKRFYPDVVFYLLSDKPFTLVQLATYASPDHYLSKEYLGTKEYECYVRTVTTSLLRRHPFGDLVYNFDLRKMGPSHARSKLKEHEIRSIIEQCLFGVDGGGDGTQISRVELDPITGGFSGSGVYSMNMWMGGRENGVPAILKVSEKTRAKEELVNYNRFVKWRLPYLFRVDVMGFGAAGDFGGICYSFARAGGRRPLSANHFLRLGEMGVVDSVVGGMLASSNQNWYAERRPSGKDARLYFGEQPYYNKNQRRVERERIFFDELRKEGRKSGFPVYLEDQKLLCGGRTYFTVNRCLFGRDWGKVTECVCHGDLNGENVMYTGEDGGIAFIDFQNTGFHYLFRDFVFFEGSVRLEVPGEHEGWTEQTVLDVLRGEERLAGSMGDGTSGQSKYIEAAGKIRVAAKQNFPDESEAIYLVANAVHALWLLEKDAWKSWQKVRLLASILASLGRLQSIAEEL